MIARTTDFVYKMNGKRSAVDRFIVEVLLTSTRMW
jgi:hypothetical protein